jgi:hypothetical protein
VEEQSHKDEMRAAVKGDFERLRQRVGDGVEPVLRPPPRKAPATPAVEPTRTGRSWLGRVLGR